MDYDIRDENNNTIKVDGQEIFCGIIDGNSAAAKATTASVDDDDVEDEKLPADDATKKSSNDDDVVVIHDETKCLDVPNTTTTTTTTLVGREEKFKHQEQEEEESSSSRPTPPPQNHHALDKDDKDDGAPLNNLLGSTVPDDDVVGGPVLDDHVAPSETVLPAETALPSMTVIPTEKEEAMKQEGGVATSPPTPTPRLGQDTIAVSSPSGTTAIQEEEEEEEEEGEDLGGRLIEEEKKEPADLPPVENDVALMDVVGESPEITSGEVEDTCNSNVVDVVEKKGESSSGMSTTDSMLEGGLRGKKLRPSIDSTGASSVKDLSKIGDKDEKKDDEDDDITSRPSGDKVEPSTEAKTAIEGNSDAVDERTTLTPPAERYSRKMPKMRRRTDNSSSSTLTSSTLTSKEQEEQPTQGSTEDVSSNKTSYVIDPAEFHLKVCRPRRRRRYADQRASLKSMNAHATAMYSRWDPTPDNKGGKGSSGTNPPRGRKLPMKGGVPPPPLNAGLSNTTRNGLPPPPLRHSGSQDSRGSGGMTDEMREIIAKNPGLWEKMMRTANMGSSGSITPSGGDARRDVGAMGGGPRVLSDYIPTPVDFRRDDVSNMMRGMTPRNTPLGQYGGGGGGGMDEIRDLLMKNPALLDQVMQSPALLDRMLSTMNAGRGSAGMPFRGMMDVGGNRSDAGSTMPMNAFPSMSDSYRYGGNQGSAEEYFNAMKRKYADIGMQGEFPPKSPNPKKRFMQRDRVMDAEVRQQMNAEIRQQMMDVELRNRMMEAMMPKNNFGNSSSHIMPHASNAMGNMIQTTSSADGVGRTMNTDTGDKLKSSKKTGAPAKKSKKTKSTSEPVSVDSSTPTKSLEELKTTILSVMGLPTKPKRPFSLYNLFFQLEREYILNELKEGRQPSDDPLSQGNEVSKAGETKVGRSGDDAQDDPKFYVDPNIPARYSHLKLDKLWYSVGHKPKRKHRKTEGSCSFMELTRMVSTCWKNIDAVDPYIKQYCQKLADEELIEYKSQVENYKKIMKSAEMEASSKAAILMQAQTKNKNLSDPQLADLEESAPTVKSSTKNKKRNLKKNAADDTFEEEINPTKSSDRMSVGNFAEMARGSVPERDFARFMEMARMGGVSYPGIPPLPSRHEDIPREPRMNAIARNSAGADRALPSTALAAQMAEARMAHMRMAAREQIARTTNTADSMRMFDPHYDRSSHATVADTYIDDQDVTDLPSDIQQKFAALAEAEARHRMQMDMQQNVMRNRSQERGGFRNLGRGPPQNPFQQGDRISQDNNDQMGPESLAVMQRKFMEQFGIDVSASAPGQGADNVSAAAYNRPDGGRANAPEEEEFDGEVDQFLSTLKEEIKQNRRNQMMQGGSGANNANIHDFLGGVPGLGSNTGRSPLLNAGGRGMAAIGRMPSLGGTTPYQESMSMGNNMGMNEQLLHQMMLMRRGNGGSLGGSLGVSPSFPTSRMMEELRRQVAANNSNSQTLPDLPFANGGRGGGGNDDPALPEYGYGDE